tara:strand:+ start:1535 stop:2695 length:1161 start_codon:yes stop_codon:yes gene_type:complete
MEAFYQLKFHPYAIDNCGTFFGADTLAEGCTDRLVVAAGDAPQGDPSLETAAGSRYIVRTRHNKEASDDGQFGIAFRYFVPELNDSEFGFYAMNYHSRAPIYSSIAGDSIGRFSGGDPGTLIQGLQGAGPAGYFFEYPEDIRLYGVSFQTSVSGVSLGGEFSYRPNMPMQINTGDMSRTAIFNAVDGSDNIHRGETYVNGDYIQGYDRKEFYQAQVTAIKFIDRVLGASRLSLVGEAGVNYIGGISNDPGKTKYGRDSLFGQSPFADGTCSSQTANNPLDLSPKADSWCETDGFYTDWSYGYRARASLSYSNVFAGVNLTPNLAWSHDIEGYGPNFNEDAKSISIGLDADYANKYSAGISYTNFFDGKYNTNVDRDFASVNFSVSF